MREEDGVVSRFERTIDAGDVDAFITAMWNKDERTSSEMLSKIRGNEPSCFWNLYDPLRKIILMPTSMKKSGRYSKKITIRFCRMAASSS